MSLLKSRVGIIGGAGPIAGALLFEKIINMCQKYGCEVDADFPYCLLINYPFAPMLTANFNKECLQKQLEECFSCFTSQQITIVAIACNTLHAFLPSLPSDIQLVHMIEVTKEYLTKIKWKEPLVLCSSTSAQTKLHAKYFNCRYPNSNLQKMIDDLIDEVTKGCCVKYASRVLNSICRDEGQTILGCTELSLIHQRAPLNKEVCIPDSLVAEKIGELIFKTKV